jgi:hypothetical protein
VEQEHDSARDLKMARRHLRMAIARLDRLRLPILAAHTDLALARLEESHPENASPRAQVLEPKLSLQ